METVYDMLCIAMRQCPLPLDTPIGLGLCNRSALIYTPRKLYSRCRETSLVRVHCHEFLRHQDFHKGDHVGRLAPIALCAQSASLSLKRFEQMMLFGADREYVYNLMASLRVAYNGRACWMIFAAANSRSSCHRGATSCSEIGASTL